MIAHLKAVLGLDSMPYKAGSRGVKQENRGIQQSFAKIGAAIGVSFGIAQIVRAGRALVDYASQASIAARNVGMLTSEMMALNRVGQTAGMQSRQMEQLISRMSTELFEAARGSETAEKKFTDMGLSIDELIRMDPAQQLQAVARAAFDTGVPLGHLADLFGQRLGPQAMTALRRIADEGFPAVQKAIGEMADSIEGMGSKWAEIIDVAKGFGLAIVNALDVAHSAVSGFVSGPLGNTLEALKAIRDLDLRKAAGHVRKVVNRKEMVESGVAGARSALDERAQRIERARVQREREAAERTEQTQALRKQAEAEAEAKKKAEAQKTAETLADREQKEQAANDRMERQRLEGEQRITADFLAARADAVRQMEQAETDSMRNVFLARLELMDRYYVEDLKAHKDAEQEKLNTERQRQEQALERLQDRLQQEQARTMGVGVDQDAMARVGGFLGGHRAGMAMEDRPLRIAEATHATLEEIKTLVQQMEGKESGRVGGGI